MIEKASELLRRNPSSEVITIAKNDWGGQCECPNCKAIDEPEGTRGATQLLFINKVAEALAEEFPYARVATYAYLETSLPPKTIKPAKNVIILLCTEGHAWPYTWIPISQSQQYPKTIAAWRAAGANIHIWDYTVSFRHYMVPMLNWQAAAENIRYFVQHGVTGVSFQGGYQCPGAENAAMRSWVWAKQLWDPSRDTYQLMRDFTLGYYGTAAEPVWQYNEMLYKTWEAYSHLPMSVNPMSGYSVGTKPTDALFSRDFVEPAAKLFAKAESLAKDPETLRKVHIAELPLMYIRLCQGLGWTGRDHPYEQGDWFKSPQPGKKEDYRKLLDKFESIVRAEKITCFEESIDWVTPDGDKRLAQWHELLEKLP
jgi:hypothetical protein